MRVLHIIATTLLITGCATSPKPAPCTQLHRLTQGMTKEEASRILGPPTQAATGAVYEAPHVQSGGFSEIHRYLSVSRGTTNDCVLVFYKGKLTEYGPYIGDLQTRYPVFP